MKLKNFRRVAALGMAVGMTAVLAACGNTADTASSETAESTAETADTAEEASAETADAEYAYLADFSGLGGGGVSGIAAGRKHSGHADSHAKGCHTAEILQFHGILLSFSKLHTFLLYTFFRKSKMKLL